jgi:hypothetical protein
MRHRLHFAASDNRPDRVPVTSTSACNAYSSYYFYRKVIRTIEMQLLEEDHVNKPTVMGLDFVLYGLLPHLLFPHLLFPHLLFPT